MNPDLRRAKRYTEFIPVFVTAQNGANGMRAAGPFAGRVIDISRYGACLLISLGGLEAYNVYRTTIHYPSSFLVIQGTLSLEAVRFNLSARPVWSDPFILDDLRAFNMGIEFLGNPQGEQMSTIIESISAK